jgi:hypothetical protein
VLIFLVVDIVILTICTGLDNVRLEAELVTNRERSSGKDVRS